MIMRAVLPLGLLALMGCPGAYPVETETCALLDLSASVSLDLKPLEAKCKAAQGLAGDNLICVDFDKVTGLSDPALGGWNFNAINTMCPGWIIGAGKLQIDKFSTFLSGSCGFTMPTVNLNDQDKAKYKNITLSVLQKVDIIDQQQYGQVFLGQDLSSRQISYETGKNPRQANMVSIDKSDQPMGVNGNFQYWFKLTSSSGGGIQQNWFIESIAVNANP